MGQNPAVFSEKEDGGQQQAAVLSADRAQGHAPNLHVEVLYKNKTAEDVHDIYRDGNGHGVEGVLHSQKPAVNYHEEDGGRCGPNADKEVLPGQGLDFGTALEQPKTELCQGTLQQNQQEGADQCHQQTPLQHQRHFAAVLAPVGLGRYATDAHAQKGEAPVHKVENDPAQRHGAHKVHRALVPHQVHVYHAQHGHGKVGQDVGDGESEDGFVHFFGCKSNQISGGDLNLLLLELFVI